MYTLDCLYLNKDALNLKKKLLRTTEKVFSLYVCNVSLLHRNPGLPLTTEEQILLLLFTATFHTT